MEIIKRLQAEWIDIDDAGFLCEPLTAAQKISVARCVEMDDFGEAMITAARSAVTNWRGITEDGKTVPYSVAALDRLFGSEDMAQALVTLGTFIINRARLSADDEKKS